MKQTLAVKLGQQLKMTPQLQQAIKLLQMSSLELTEEIENALEENPLLEREDEQEMFIPDSSPTDTPDFSEDFNFFYTTFILIIIPFLIINGALTGLFFDQTVVWYNNKEILGLRIFTIPLEDAFYAHQLILLNLMFYKKYSSSNTKI